MTSEVRRRTCLSVSLLSLFYQIVRPFCSGRHLDSSAEIKQPLAFSDTSSSEPKLEFLFHNHFLSRCSSAGVVEDIMMCLKASFTAAHEATRRESLAKEHVEQCEECPLVCWSQHLYAVFKNSEILSERWFVHTSSWPICKGVVQQSLLWLGRSSASKSPKLIAQKDWRSRAGENEYRFEKVQWLCWQQKIAAKLRKCTIASNYLYSQSERESILAKMQGAETPDIDEQNQVQKNTPIVGKLLFYIFLFLGW